MTVTQRAGRARKAEGGTPMKAKRDAKKAARTTKRLPGETRREQIVAIAAELFAERGYLGTSLRDVAEVSGLTKAALYYHFPDKEFLFEAVVNTRMEAANAAVREAMDAKDDPVEKIRAFMVTAAERIDSDRVGWVASASTFWSLKNPETRDRIVVQRDAYEGQLRAAVTQAIKQGLLRDIDAAMFTRLLLAGISTIPRWHKPGKGLTAVDVVEKYLDYALVGALAERP